MPKKSRQNAPPTSEVVLAQEIEMIEISRLKPVESNPRYHSAANVQKIAESIKTYGWTTPVLVTDELELIAGHGRLLGAERLGIKEVPCIKLSHLTPELVEAYRIADNRLALDSEWDDELLQASIKRLSQNPDFDLTLTGFNSDEIEEFLQAPAGGDNGEDNLPNTVDVPVVTIPGDVWELEKHRLICGDCTDQAIVEALLSGRTVGFKTDGPNLMVTDPPYGVEYDPAWREGVDLGVGERSKGKVQNDNRADWREAWQLFQGSIAYVWHAGLFAGLVGESLAAAGFKLRSQIIWSKQHFVLSRGDYHWQHEPCWYAVREKGNWCGDRSQSTVWEIQNNNSFGNSKPEETFGHGTQKPVECMRRPILNNTKRGDQVYDPFMGSGTTIIAAETTARVAYGCEINPAYVDMAVMRWERFTGKRARLAGENKTFEEVARWRHKEPQS